MTLSRYIGASNPSTRRSITLLLLMIVGATALYLYLYEEALLQSTSVYSLPRLIRPLQRLGLSSQDLKVASENLKTGILEGSSLPLLTLFSTWTDREDLETMRNLTLRNWSQLRPFIQPLLFTNSSRLAAGARSYGWEALPVSTAAVGVPVLKIMYLDAMKRFNSSLYCFANGDILFTSSLVDSLLAILSDRLLSLDNHPLLAIGQRTNVANVTDAEALTFSNISKAAKARGKLFTVLAEDYFITNRRFGWERVPDVVIGRSTYDNWLVMHAIQQRHVVVDMTQTALAVHQTTRFGNFEGWTHANSSYNRQLLWKLYKRIYFGRGRTSCAPWKTLRTKEGALTVEKRKAHC